MRAWLLTIGEPLPTDNTHPRLLRAGLLARALTVANHDVVWWTSTFEAMRKKARYESDQVLRAPEGYEIRLLHGGGYRRNISLQRHRYHRRIAAKFAHRAPIDPAKPDVILSSLPILELCGEAVRFGRASGTPVVLDVRDLWPEVLLGRVPAPLHSVARLALRPALSAVNSVCGNAAAITGVTSEYVAWGVRNARRKHTSFDRPFPHGYPEAPPPDDALRAAYGYWAEQHGIFEGNRMFVACFFGTLGPHFDLRTVIDSARRLESRGMDGFKFVLCGSGPHLEACRRLSADLRSVVVPGWVDAAQIWALMRMSSVGLACYESTPNFVANVPNKPVEYLSAGLPIVSSLTGALEKLLLENRCGLTYANGDVDGLVDLLLGLRGNEGLRNAMAVEALRLFRSRFVAEVVYAEMGKYLEEVSAAEYTS